MAERVAERRLRGEAAFAHARQQRGEIARDQSRAVRHHQRRAAAAAAATAAAAAVAGRGDVVDEHDAHDAVLEVRIAQV